MNKSDDSESEMEMHTDESTSSFESPQKDEPQRLISSISGLQKKRSFWKRDLNSYNRMQGKEYVGTSKIGDVRVETTKPAKTVGMGCTEKSRCRRFKSYQCSEIPPDARKKLLSSFLKMSKTVRETYMATLINNDSKSNLIQGDKPSTRTYFFAFA